ncbi:restriction endonuclease subunit S [Collinsella aerofaciens]|uniref:restriction endonuclease subunit S n=1 Tax=Collinsella aerofaciens TaxID=74426 RepID=UPI001E50A876|nr:restriction endonuclease subunit S [Collinsella aerofaciens]
MAEKTNVPEIRFAGFTDPWEQRKLGELFVESDERSSTEEILSVSVANGIYPASESERDTNPGASIANYKIVRVGDIVYNSMRMWQGAVGSSRYNGIVSPAYVVAKPVVELDSTCFGYLLKRPELLYKYLCNSQGNSKDTQTLRYERFAEITAEVPSTIEEQRAISDCLVGLDNLITLHQRKYDKLAQLKKSMLDKMFPKPGERFPEIRFAGFTDPWEQRKLGEVAHRVIRKNEGNQSDLPLTISAQHGLVDQRGYFNNQVASRDMSGYYLLENGEFAYNKSTSGDSPWGAIKRLTKYEKGCLSTLYICFGLDLGDPDFLVTYYETNRWHGAVQMIAAEGARNHGLLNIAPDDFFETAITLPCSTEEQKQIGCFFIELNSLITLHQRKLELLRNTKKSLLDRMFV